MVKSRRLYNVIVCPSCNDHLGFECQNTRFSLRQKGPKPEQKGNEAFECFPLVWRVIRAFVNHVNGPGPPQIGLEHAHSAT